MSGLEGILRRTTQLANNRLRPFPKLDVQLHRPQALFIRIHGQPPSSPRFCPHPQLSSFRRFSTVEQTKALLGYVYAQRASNAGRSATGTGDLRVERLDQLLELGPGRSLVDASQESCAAGEFFSVGLHG